MSFQFLQQQSSLPAVQQVSVIEHQQYVFSSLAAVNHQAMSVQKLEEIIDAWARVKGWRTWDYAVERVNNQLFRIAGALE